MLPVRELAFIFCVLSCLELKTLQKELGFSHGVDDDEWTQMKWDSILKDPATLEKSSNFPEEDPNTLDSFFPFENEPNKDFKSKTKLSESEEKIFSEDEVFIAETKIAEKESAKSDKDISDESNSCNARGNECSSKNQPAVLGEDLNADHNIESKIESDLNPKLDNSQLLISNAQGANSVESFDPRSFIFNPGAKPEEQFQNCTTPKNESGTCRYLQHCMIPSIVSSLGQFMDYVCIIEGRFIGVCCPMNPASIIVIKEEDKGKEDNSTVDGNLNDQGNDTEEISPNEECGISTNTRIVGGAKADPKAWPWMVALFSKLRKRFFCGGALINDRYVLTAAHCTFGVFNNEIVARVGEYDFKDDGESHDDFAVVEIKRHGHYNRRTLRNDIALLKLEKPVVFNEFVKTICFPEEENDYVGEIATLAGWGNIAGGGKTSDVLLEASFPIISNEECSKGHGLPIPESLICTGAEKGDKGACNGDSGGPLMLLDKNNRWKTIGLVSWGRRGCNPEFPTVYTRVSHFLDWIRKHTK